MEDQEIGVREEIRRLMLKTAPALMRRDGYLEPVAFLGDSEEGRITLVGIQADFSDPSEKDAVGESLRQAISDFDADVFGFVSEAWLSLITEDEAEELERSGEGLNVRERIDRQEVIMITLETKSGDDQFWTCDVARIDDEVYVEDPEEHEAETGVGRFSGVFKEESEV